MERKSNSSWSTALAGHAAGIAAHAASRRYVKPKRGRIVAFKFGASEALAGIPARVTDVWPRLASGDYLITLEYAQAVKFRATFITHIEAFWSDVDVVAAPEREAQVVSRSALS